MNRQYILVGFVVFCLFVVLHYLFYSNSFLSMVFYEKIWIHRVNSKEKLNEIKDSFFGVEVDLVFQDSTKCFDVNHPPEKSIGLNLNEFLSSASDNKKLSYWFDFKNLEPSNQKHAIECLNTISEKLSISKNQIIVESPRVELLDSFSKQGYQVSYYLHWPGLYTLSDSNLNQELIKINSTIKNLNWNGFISSDYRDYSLLNIYFSTHKKLLWLDDSFGKENKFRDRLTLFEMLSDDNVSVVLMKYKAKTIER